MGKRRNASQTERDAKARREFALQHFGAYGQSVPRENAASPTSAAVKSRDPDVDRMIAEFEARRSGA